MRILDCGYFGSGCFETLGLLGMVILVLSILNLGFLGLGILR